jgi:uncharacterized delta-60 repeat protein
MKSCYFSRLGLIFTPRATFRPAVCRQALKASVLLLALALFLVLPGSAAAGDGALDLTFNPGAVQKIPVIRGAADYLNGNGSASGTCLIYGYFTSITDSASQIYNRNSIARINANGTLDASFNIPVDGEVRTLFLVDSQSLTSDIIIGGHFSLEYDSTTYYNLARLTWSGSAYEVDTNFPHIFYEGMWSYGAVNIIARQASTGNILVGGYNMQVQGDNAHAYHLIRLSSTWAYDVTYAARSAPGGSVHNIDLYDANFPDQARIFGTLPNSPTHAGNDYMQLLDTDLTGILQSLGDNKLNGAINGMFQWGAGQPWIVWGGFTQAFDKPLNHIARLTYDLTGLTSTASGGFNDNIIQKGGADQTLGSMLIQGSQFVLTGYLTKFNGTPCGHIVRINTSGIVDPDFNANASGADDRIFRAYIPNGATTIRILGSFRNYNDTSRGGIATLSSNGSIISDVYAGVTAHSNTPGKVRAMAWDQSGFIIGGDFTGVGGKWHQNLARFNWDGSVDASFLCNVDGDINSMISNGNQRLLVGTFGATNGVGRTSLARLNITYSTGPNLNTIATYSLDTAFNPVVTQADGSVPELHRIQRDDNGSFLIMGHFGKINNSASNSVARLQANGLLDTSFVQKINTSNSIWFCVSGGGRMGDGYGMVGYDSVLGNFACRLLYNGDLDQSFGITHFDSEPLDGAVQPDGRLLVCGSFTRIIDGSTNPIRGGIARINSNGSLDGAFAPNPGANDEIFCLDVQANGKILIGGSFTSYNTVARNHVARLNADGSLDTSFDPGDGANGKIDMVSWIRGQNVAYLGGNFSTYNNISRGSLARIMDHGNIGLPPLSLLLGD